MRISKIETFLMRAAWPGTPTPHPPDSRDMRHWCFVRIHTDEGVTGVGEGSGWPRLVEQGVQDLAPSILGEDPFDIERLWQKMMIATMGHGMTGTVGGGVMTAIETALWDIKGKALGTPVWNLLGGRVRDRVRVYAHVKDADQARSLVGRGYTALKCGGIDGIVDKVGSLRAAVGSDIDLMVDLHGPPWLTAADAIAIGRALEPYHLLFLEDPVAPEMPSALRRVRDALSIPIAAGERLSRLWSYAPLIAEGLIDIVQPDTGRAGGILQLRKIAALAEAFGVMVAPHSGSLGPVAEYAALHVLASIPNALILETFADDCSSRYKVVDPVPRVEAGHMLVPDAPGLGVELVVDEIHKHPPAANCSVPGGALSRTYEPGTFHEHVYVQTRWRRARSLGGAVERE